MELQNTVKEALNALYHHPDDTVRMQADRWLQDFQRTLDAWQVADNLLHDATSNLETLIFCSQTLRSKVQRDFEELPSEAFRPLRDSLNTLLKKFHKGPPKVRTQISIAVAALAVYVPAEDWGDGGIVNWLRDEMKSHPEYIPGFLELLTVLAEPKAPNYTMRHNLPNNSTPIPTREPIPSHETILDSLKINLRKSEMVPIGDVPHLEDLAGILGCKTSILPMQYLGLPLGAKYKAKAIWNRILERLEHRLAGWKRLYLSKGGQVTLIKSTLSSLPTYFVSLIQRNFLWSGIGEKHKIPLVKWSKICTPYNQGGLAVKNLRLFNEALLGKWLWRFGVEREALWRQVIVGKYGSLIDGLKNLLILFRFFKFEVGVGSQTRFWLDFWCGEGPLKDTYPELFWLARNKNALVGDYMDSRNGCLHWELQFSCSVQYWELESVSTFLDLLYSAKVKGHVWLWSFPGKPFGNPSPVTGGFLFLDSMLGKFFNCGQSSETEHLPSELVLYVQSGWRVH
uniref:Importin N-terminal domain-containing protein n=1 Tax=Fagus sylvatica TaxID=28930 RepID=A0A2N9H6K9_FAGSY